MRSLGLALIFLLLCRALAESAVPREENAVLYWNSAALQGVHDSKLGAPMIARALAIVDTCMYDAWAAYDERAVGTQLLGVLRRPGAQRTLADKERAISYAAYHALADVLPADTESVYKPLMKQLGYDPDDRSFDIETPTGIGNVACGAVLEFRHHDESNQLGDLAQGPYSDWTGYVPANHPTMLPVRIETVDPNHWQPLVFVNSSGDLITQTLLGAQWRFVTPFALSGDEFRSVAQDLEPAIYGSEEYRQQAEDLIKISAGLTDREKMISEYWSDGPDSQQPPGHWMLLAQWVSVRDHHTLDDDVKMFFILSNAIFDAGISAWDMKLAYDSVRPVTAIPVLFSGKKIRAWGGPGKGTVEIDGAQWMPYQSATFPTPPFPDYVSGHSTFSAAAAYTLAKWTGGDRFGYSVTLPPGSSKIEPGITPARSVVLKWDTFTDASDQAGMSRRYGGIHFERADLAGRKLGKLVAEKAWLRAQSYFDGTAKPPNRQEIQTLLLPGNSTGAGETQEQQ